MYNEYLQIKRQDITIKNKAFTALILAFSLLAGGCSRGETPTQPSDNATSATTHIQITESSESSFVKTPSLHQKPVVQANGDVVILMTGDVHSSFDKGFSFGGVYEIRYQMELKGDTVLLVDDGDAIQGTPYGYFTRGEAIMKLMNDLGYDVAIPGEHEFEYGMDRFLEFVDKANFDYICCNLEKDGKQVLKPYVIKEACGKRIAFVGITTPKAITLVPPEAFQDGSGKFIYGFMQDETGDLICKAAQDAIDKARAEGADHVVLMGHIGNDETSAPWTYDKITSRLSGYDVYLDGFSHDLQIAEIMTADGKLVKRIPAGTRLNALGWVRFSAKDGEITTGVYQWQSNVDPAWLFDFENPMTKRVAEAKKESEKYLP